MLRLFAHPNYSFLGSLASLTPFATEKVTIGLQTNQTERVSRIWQMASLVICLAFWKVLLPLSITIALCYQISSEYRACNREHEARLLQKDLITKIDEDRANLTRFAVILTPPTAIHLFDGNEFSKLELVQALSTSQLEQLGGNDRYFSLDEPSLAARFKDLPKEKQAFLAQVVYNEERYNLEEALRLDPDFTDSPSFKLDMLGSGDAILSTLAFVHMPDQPFVKALESCPLRLNTLLLDPTSLITLTIADSTNIERLRAIAFTKNREGAHPYLESVALILPKERRAAFLENLPQEQASTFTRACEAADEIATTTQIGSLAKDFSEGALPMAPIENESIRRIYYSEALTPSGKEHFLRWLMTNQPEGFEYLAGKFPLDLGCSFTEELRTYFGTYSKETRLSLFYARGTTEGWFFNIQTIVECVEAEEWTDLLTFESLERREEELLPETPRTLIRAIIHNGVSDSPGLSDLEKIRGTAAALELMSCNQLAALEVPAEVLPEVLNLFVELIGQYFKGYPLWEENPKKMALLMQRAQEPLFIKAADHLIEVGLNSTIAHRVAGLLRDERPADFLKICHQKGILSDAAYFRHLPAPQLPEAVANAADQIDPALIRRIQSLDDGERTAFFQGLCTQPRLREEGLLELLTQVEPEGASRIPLAQWIVSGPKTVFKETAVVAINAALAEGRLTGPHTPGRAVVNWATNGHYWPTRLRIMNLLIDLAESEEIIPLFKIQPVYVLHYLIAHNKFGTEASLAASILWDETEGTKASDLNPNDLFQNLNSYRRDQFLIYLAQTFPHLFTRYAEQMGEVLLLECIRSLQTFPSEEKQSAIDLFLQANPVLVLSHIGSRAMVTKAKELDLWDALDPEVQLRCSSFKALLEETRGDEHKFKGIIQAHSGNSVEALAAFINTCEPSEAVRCFGWAHATLDHEDAGSLLTQMIGPGDNMKRLKDKLTRFKKEAPEHNPLRQRLIREHADLIAAGDISEAFISWNAAYALEALKNPRLSLEQKGAFIGASSFAIEIIDYALSDKELSAQYLEALAQKRGSHLHLWHFIGKMDPSLKPKLLRLDHEQFPAPKTQEEWETALELTQVREHLTSLIHKYGWDKAVPLVLEQKTKQRIVDTLIHQGFWGRYYANRSFGTSEAPTAEKIAAVARASGRTAQEILSPRTPPRRATPGDFLSTPGFDEAAAELDDLESISPPFTPMASPKADAANGHFEPTGGLPRTPAPNGHLGPVGGEEGFVTSRTLARTPVRTPARHLQTKVALPSSSPLASAPHIGGRERQGASARLFDKEPATTLAEQIIRGQRTYASALEENAQFLSELPPYKEGEPFLFGALCHKVEESLVRVMLNKCPQHALDVVAYLSQPEFGYSPDHPKLLAAIKPSSQLIFG